MLRIIGSICFALIFAMSAFANSDAILSPDDVLRRSVEAVSATSSFSVIGERKIEITETSTDGPILTTETLSTVFVEEHVRQQYVRQPNGEERVALSANFTMQISVPGERPLSFPQTISVRRIGDTCFSYGLVGLGLQTPEWGEDSCSEIFLPEADMPAASSCIERMTVEKEGGVLVYTLSFYCNPDKINQALGVLLAKKAFSEAPGNLRWTGTFRINGNDFLPMSMTASLQAEKVADDGSSRLSLNITTESAFRDYGKSMAIDAPEIPKRSQPELPPDAIEEIEKYRRESCKKYPDISGCEKYQ